MLLAVTFGIALLSAGGRAEAQIFQLQAGSSTLYQAHGGSISVVADGYEGRIGLGDLHPFRLGASLHTRYRGSDLTFGDQTVPFHLPTDVLGTGYSFSGRGVGVGYEEDGVRLFAMGGTTSTGFSAPYVSVARSEDPIGLCFLESQVSRTVRVTSRSIFAARPTTILGAEWQPRNDLQAALAGGTGGAGAETGYLAATSRFDREWITIQAGYVFAGDRFHRVITPQALSSELDRENVQVMVRPRPGFTLSAGRNRYLQPSVEGKPGVRGTVNQFLAGGTVAGTALNAAFFESETPGAGGTGVSISMGRQLTRFLNLNGSVLQSDPRRGDPSVTLLGNVRETVSPHLDLVQFVTHSEGNTTVSFGGNITSNRLSVGVEYQTIYVPFVREDQFRQALMVTFRLQALGNFQANVGSYVGPDGRVRYTASGSQYVYRGAAAPSPQEAGLYNNVAHGVVSDENGDPVSGAALKVDGEVVYSNSEGTFFVRKSKAREYSLSVLTDEFLVAGRYEVLYAPSGVIAGPEESEPPIAIVVRRRPPGSN